MIPIFHLSSHARAGETLTLKLLNAHSRVHVPLQITESEDEKSRKLIKWIRDTESQNLPLNDPYIQHANLTPQSIIVVKQGVWAPQKFNGFGLIRNPFSFSASLLEYNRREGLNWGTSDKRKYKKTYKRLLNWSQGMSASLTSEIERTPSVIDALTTFYTHRVTWIMSQNETTLKYEDLVHRPQKSLSSICKIMNIEFEDNMLTAHKQYEASIKGHGHNKLNSPINLLSLNKWKEQLSPNQISHIHFRTLSTLLLANYDPSSFSSN